MLTLWLAGWVPSIIWSWNVGGHYGPQFYAIWIILAPVFGGCAVMAGIGLFFFYQWAFEPEPRASRADLEQRIRELERETGIGQ